MTSRIAIKGLSGPLCTVLVDNGRPVYVRDVRLSICDLTGIGPYEQRLVDDRMVELRGYDSFDAAVVVSDELTLVRRSAIHAQWFGKALEGNAAHESDFELTSSYESAPEEVRQDRELSLLLLRRGRGCLFRCFPLGIRGNREVALEALHHDLDNFWSIPEDLRIDSSFILEAVQKNGCILQQATMEQRDNKFIVSEAVRDDYRAFQFASETLRADRMFVHMILKSQPLAFQFVAGELRADRELVLEAVQRDARMICYSSPEMHADHKVMREVVRQNGWLIQLVPNDSPLLMSREFVMAAVSQDGIALRFLPANWRSDVEVAVTAVRQDANALEFVDKLLRAELERQHVLEVGHASIHSAQDGVLGNHVIGAISSTLGHSRSRSRSRTKS